MRALVQRTSQPWVPSRHSLGFCDQGNDADTGRSEGVFKVGQGRVSDTTVGPLWLGPKLSMEAVLRGCSCNVRCHSGKARLDREVGVPLGHPRRLGHRSPVRGTKTEEIWVDQATPLWTAATALGDHRKARTSGKLSCHSCVQSNFRTGRLGIAMLWSRWCRKESGHRNPLDAGCKEHFTCDAASAPRWRRTGRRQLHPNADRLHETRRTVARSESSSPDA